MEKRVIAGIREYYKLSNDVTDEQIINNYKGSLGEACMNIRFAKEDFKKAFGMRNNIKAGVSKNENHM